MPGRAWLEMRAERVDDQHSRYRQRAVFLPRGLAGHAYWASVLPFHGVVFSGMARNIARGATASVVAKPQSGVDDRPAYRTLPE